ncbi:DNA polymerase IV [Nitrospira moscoviensis]|uniref:DNA polymerase IV n=1 Tax=Nitrospira moscoviensis TaxID=42253 RepID=A0A0K2GIQ3_NITMO|nr:DNA polymerase IV [Nitrospira moscoviensis]ALA60487.1 DNA polymerase IV [Nitrospira moscoviensis]
MPRIVAHLDMDAFFAAIEERDTPAFRGLPLVVGADPRGGKGRGVAATSNYRARAYGIHSATPISVAWRLSEAARRAGKPPVTFVSVDMAKYARVSDAVLGIMRRFIPLVEPASIDEAYGDVSATGSYEEAERLCRELKQAIRTEQRLTASVGIGPNKLIAKIASGLRKPDGLTVVREAEAEAFLEPLSVRAIPGIGPKTERHLARQGIMLVRDLKTLGPARLEGLLGKRGVELYDKVRGLDSTPVETSFQPKSIGEQETFETDVRDSRLLVEQLAALSRDVIARLHREGLHRFRTIVLTVRFADFETKSRARTLARPAGEAVTLRREALKLLMPFLDRRDNPRRKAIRLLGLRVEQLDEGRQRNLYGQE